MCQLISCFKLFFFCFLFVCFWFSHKYAFLPRPASRQELRKRFTVWSSVALAYLQLTEENCCAQGDFCAELLVTPSSCGWAKALNKCELTADSACVPTRLRTDTVFSGWIALIGFFPPLVLLFFISIYLAVPPKHTKLFMPEKKTKKYQNPATGTQCRNRRQGYL